jgi:peptidoglycan L-alanyl-D-glutamate endopeptidase CwlK
MMEVIKIFDIAVLCGHRGKEEQNKHYSDGVSKVRWPNSKHNTYPSNAIDIAPYYIDWKDYKRFFFMAGIVKGIAHCKGYSVVWGGDWNSNNNFNDQTFDDLVHFEVK